MFAFNKFVHRSERRLLEPARPLISAALTQSGVTALPPMELSLGVSHRAQRGEFGPDLGCAGAHIPLLHSRGPESDLPCCIFFGSQAESNLACRRCISFSQKGGTWGFGAGSSAALPPLDQGWAKRGL